MGAFPSPAQDYAEQSINLHDLLVKHPTATYFVRAADDSMINGGIGKDDLLVVDSARTAVHNNIVIAAINGEFIIRQLQLRPVIQLMPLNRAYKPTFLGTDEALEVFGVVTFIVKAASE